MARVATSIKVEGLDQRQLSGLKRKARRLRTSPQAYIRALIEQDLKLDHLVATRSLSQLSKPFEQAFGEIDEEEIGRLVEASREKHQRRLSKR